LRLDQVTYDAATGQMRYPHHDEPVPEAALAGYLDEAQDIVAGARARAGQNEASDGDRLTTSVSADFEHLRWFELPASCLA
jgi:hypothetical protein